jgi:hypothetical protein
VYLTVQPVLLLRTMDEGVWGCGTIHRRDDRIERLI